MEANATASVASDRAQAQLFQGLSDLPLTPTFFDAIP